jgi:2-keto-3-deoxy-L-rhamnonate aldolase RhmA
MKQSNRVKAAMRAGRKAYGYNLSFPSPWVIDILGKLDFDFVFIDGEHGPFWPGPARGPLQDRRTP